MLKRMRVPPSVVRASGEPLGKGVVKHTRSARSSRGRRGLLALIALLAVPLVWFGATRGIDSLVRNRLGAILGAAVSFESMHLRGDGLDLGGVTVGTDPDVQLAAHAVSVDLRWTSMLTAHPRVQRIDVDGLDVRIRSLAPRDGRARPTASLASLEAQVRAAGVGEIRVRRAGVVIGDDGRDRIRVRELDASVRVRPGDASLMASAGELDVGDTSARSIELTGRILRDRFDVERVAAAVANGSVEGRGTLDAQSGQWSGALHIGGVEAGTLARIAGLDAAVGGRVDAELTLAFARTTLRSVRGTLVLSDGLLADATGSWNGAVSLSVDATPDRVKLADVRATANDLNARAEIALARRNGEWFVRAAGHLGATGRAIRRVAARFGGGPLLAAQWSARTARLAFSASGPIDDVAGLRGGGHLRVEGLTLRPSPALAPIEVAAVEADIRPDAHGVTLAAIHASSPGLSLDGSITLRGRNALQVDRFNAHGVLSVRDASAVRRIAPALSVWQTIATTRATRGRVAFDAAGPLAGSAERTLDARFSVANVVVRGIRLPDRSTLDVPVRSSEGNLAIATASNGVRIALRDVRVESPLGSLAGHANITADKLRVSLTGTHVATEPLRWLVPGTVVGGTLEGSITFEGDLRDPVRNASGRFEVINARYVLPREADMSSRPISVARARGNFAIDAGRAAVTDLEIHSELGVARGEVRVGDADTAIRARVASNDVGRVLDLWPSLERIGHGGRGTGTVRATFDARGAHGSVEAHVDGGSVRIPNAPANVTSQPIARGDVRIAFSPTHLAIESLSLRGPRASMTASATWTYDGPVRGSGSVWLSRDYSHQLLLGYNWLAGLCGMSVLQSGFTLTGTAERLLLNTTIAHSVLWSLGSSRIPRAARDVLSGRAPLGA